MTFKFDARDTDEGFIHLSLVIDGEDVWPHPHRDDPGSEFDPEDVLSWLADAWPSLLLEQSWPIVFERDQEPRSITGLLRAAEERWDQFGQTDAEDADRESARVDTFLYHHDLAQMKHGSGLMSCFLLRQSIRMRIEINGTIRDDIAFNDAAGSLEELGNRASRLLLARGGRTASSLIRRWEARDDVDPIGAAALLSGLTRSEIEATGGLPKTFRTAFARRRLSQIANDTANPIQAAARSSGVLGPAGLSEVLSHIQALPNGNTTPIAELRRLIKRDLRDIGLPLDQGIRAAGRVREWLRLAPAQPVDLADISRRLCIGVEQIDLSDDRLDGISTIGPRHGPAIVLNRNTRRQGSKPGDLDRSLRFTWAHEIGHLLLDHDEWAALVDAARQHVPRSVETRANAFASRLLLPPRVAVDIWESAGSGLDWADLEAVLNGITERFGVPRIVAARQLARELPSERRRPIELVFRRRIDNFDGR